MLLSEEGQGSDEIDYMSCILCEVKAIGFVW